MIHIISSKKLDFTSDLLIVPLFHGEKNIRILDRDLASFVNGNVDLDFLDARAGKIVILDYNLKNPIKRIYLVYVGEKKELSPYALRVSFYKVRKFIQEERVEHISILFRDELMAHMSSSNVIESIAEGIIFGDYAFKKYKTEKKSTHPLQTISLVTRERRLIRNSERVDSYVSVTTAATNYARDLINEPACAATPIYLGKEAEKLSDLPHMSVTIWGKKEIEEHKMGGVLAVTRGAEHDPRFVDIRYVPRGAKKHICIIGKGITFDSGGLDIKNASGMLTMKMDMSGAATVLAVMQAIGKLQPKVRVTGIFATCENLVDSKSYKPGDVITMYSGKTVEITNTDAEGRLILADCITYANKLKPHAMIDVATLTGGVVVALGTQVTGVMTNNDALAGKLIASGKEVGEDFWQLPLVKRYLKHLDSEIADIENTGPRDASAIIGGLFLQEFVDSDIPWAHLDIAGTAWAEENNGFSPKGATGASVRTLIRYIMSLK
jgi:leucyl aminopeptidase